MDCLNVCCSCFFILSFVLFWQGWSYKYVYCLNDGPNVWQVTDLVLCTLHVLSTNIYVWEGGGMDG